jgi:hypothetical protein
MLKRSAAPIQDFADALPPSGSYKLECVRLEIPDAKRAVFTAKLCGPVGAAVWARAWLSTELGTLAESASEEMKAGDAVTLEVLYRGAETPRTSYMRIESVPLKSEHVVFAKLV